MSHKIFTFEKNLSVGSLEEDELIAKIHTWLGNVSPAYPEGMGDDCALVKAPLQDQILTTDSLTFGKHFDKQVAARDAGKKLIKRSLSDIAAMGGDPGYALLTLLCGTNLSLHWLHEFIVGIRESCEHHAVRLVGGDISSLSLGQFSSVLTLTGFLKNKPLLRRGAKSGDAIYVTGTLGGSRFEKHYKFKPRMAEGRWLAEFGECSALIDLTDGLAKDLPKLIPSACAAHLILERIPLSESARLCATQTGKLPIEHAFCDGEDYELLFTTDKNVQRSKFESAWATHFPKTPLNWIGQIKPSKSDATLIDAESGDRLPWTKGFDHLI